MQQQRPIFTSQHQLHHQDSVVTPPPPSSSVCPSPKNHTWIIYNRLGKCGSTSTTELITRKLSKMNDFKVYDSTKYGLKLPDRMDDKALMHALEATRRGKKALYINHVSYLGDTYDIAPDSPKPEYIQIIREPISRVISLFYFMTVRPKDEAFESKRKILREKAQWENPVGDLNLCVQYAKYPEMCENTNEMTKYFCGQTRECSNSSSPAALETAIRNMQTKYTLVGLLEEFHTTYAMLEYLLPTFFNGSSSMHIRHSNKGKSSKPNVTNETINLLKKWNANDIYLHKLIVDRFHKESQACLHI